MSSATTFAVANGKVNPNDELFREIGEPEKLVFPEKVKYNNTEDGKFLESVPAQLPQFKKKNCTEILMGSSFPSKSRVAKSNGFIHTVIDCYSSHHNLTIRPDDIWMAIMTQFSFYVNANAEKFRGKFVNFQGKKELVIGMTGSLRCCSYDLFVKLMSKKIHENLVDPEVKGWVLPNFSTTTDNDLVSCGVVFMASMKKYFDYKIVLLCGIPFITLEGTVEDWKNILQRIDKLKEYGLHQWHAMLKPILEQFVDAKKGEVDEEFWSKICHVFGGSGSSTVSGWMNAFCVFDENGNYKGGEPTSHNSGWPGMNQESVPTGIVEVDVKINDNGAEYDSVMFAGHMGYEVGSDEVSLRPTIGWVMCLRDSSKTEQI